MKKYFTLFIISVVFTNLIPAQEYSLKIFNSITNKKTYYRNVGDKVKIWTTNLNGKERLAKSKVLSINLDSISFKPRNSKNNILKISIKNLDYIEIRTPGMIITSYSLTIFGIIISGITRHPPPFWSAYRKISFNEGKWAKEICLKKQ